MFLLRLVFSRLPLSNSIYFFCFFFLNIALAQSQFLSSISFHLSSFSLGCVLNTSENQGKSETDLKKRLVFRFSTLFFIVRFGYEAVSSVLYFDFFLLVNNIH